MSTCVMSFADLPVLPRVRRSSVPVSSDVARLSVNAVGRGRDACEVLCESRVWFPLFVPAPLGVFLPVRLCTARLGTFRRRHRGRSVGNGGNRHHHRHVQSEISLRRCRIVVIRGSCYEKHGRTAFALSCHCQGTAEGVRGHLCRTRRIGQQRACICIVAEHLVVHVWGCDQRQEASRWSSQHIEHPLRERGEVDARRA